MLSGRFLTALAVLTLASLLIEQKDRYLARYGIVPEFKARIHGGTVVTAGAGAGCPRSSRSRTWATGSCAARPRRSGSTASAPARKSGRRGSPRRYQGRIAGAYSSIRSSTVISGSMP